MCTDKELCNTQHHTVSLLRATPFLNRKCVPQTHPDKINRSSSQPNRGLRVSAPGPRLPGTACTQFSIQSICGYARSLRNERSSLHILEWANQMKLWLLAASLCTTFNLVDVDPLDVWPAKSRPHLVCCCNTLRVWHGAWVAPLSEQYLVLGTTQAPCQITAQHACAIERPTFLAPCQHGITLRALDSQHIPCKQGIQESKNSSKQ